MSKLKLSIATTDYDHFRDFRSGAVQAEGIEMARYLYAVPPAQRVEALLHRGHFVGAWLTRFARDHAHWRSVGAARGRLVRHPCSGDDSHVDREPRCPRLPAPALRVYKDLCKRSPQ